MSEPVAKQGDRVVGIDTHVILVPSPGGPVPTPMPSPFSGPIQDATSDSVFVDNANAAVEGSVASNLPPHIPTGGPFQSAPSNRGTISSGSESVFASNKALARANDSVKCCNDPSDQDTGHVIAVGTVFSG